MSSEFTALQREIGATTPRVSLWLTGLKETVDQLPEFVRLAARIGVKEVYLQRLVFDDLGRGLARAELVALRKDAAARRSWRSLRRRSSAARSASQSTPRARPNRA